ncbi:hypothetical protein HKD37_14G040443 [Glycine soja]
MTLGAEFNVESLTCRDWNTSLKVSQKECVRFCKLRRLKYNFSMVLLKNCICRCKKKKRTTYISMKFSRFKKLGLGFDMLMKDRDTG